MAAQTMRSVESPRIGVYVCHCGSNIAGKVDVDEVVAYARTLPGVVVSRQDHYMCSDPGQGLIKDDILGQALNRVVVASCSPRMHEPTFRGACRQAGLNPYLYEHANIREHCSWVHESKENATRKARDLVRAAVHRVRHHRPLEPRRVPVCPNVLVVGGGVAGMQAALDIADGHHKVYLVERGPSIGGHMAQLDRTFPTLDCSECILTPKMSDVGHHPDIDLLCYSEVEDVSGSVGAFRVRVRRKARYVDENRCVGCGVCVDKCPWKVDSEFELGLAKRKAIYIPFAQAIPNVATIDVQSCAYFKQLAKSGKKKACRLCEKVCEADAIDFEQKDEIVELEVGSIIVATGYDQFDPTPMKQYGYGRYDDVITGLEFERLTCSAGPTGGKIRLRNGQTPESAAIIHCVGSRDQSYHPYCSRVCCMYGLKYAHMLKELGGDIEVYDFYIDMRCFGEGYEEFYKRVAEEGVVFIRGKVARITDRAMTEEEAGKLVLVAEDTLLGRVIRVPVDMAILCAALEPRADADKVAEMFNLNRRADGFFLERHVKLDPVATPTDGVFIAGCAHGPRDIPDTVAQAEAAAGKALSLISRKEIELEPAIAQVDPDLCVACGQCETTCSFSAPTLMERDGVVVSVVDETQCRGCGACASACPTGAMTIRHFTPDAILAQVEALLEVADG